MIYISKDILRSLFKSCIIHYLQLRKTLGPSLQYLSGFLLVSPRLGKLTIWSQLYIRIIVIVNSDLYGCWGVGGSQHLFLITSWNSTVLRHQHCISGWPDLLTIEMTLIKASTQINKTSLRTSTKTVLEEPSGNFQENPKQHLSKAEWPHRADSWISLGERRTSRHSWDLPEKSLGCLPGLNAGDTPAGPQAPGWCSKCGHSSVPTCLDLSYCFSGLLCSLNTSHMIKWLSPLTMVLGKPIAKTTNNRYQWARIQLFPKYFIVTILQTRKQRLYAG